jgi:hypothetical protein
MKSSGPEGCLKGWLAGGIAAAAVGFAVMTHGSSIAPPPAGALYHGVYPGGVSGEEDDITAAGVASYEQTVGQRVAWVYFSNNWYQSRRFPAATSQMIRAAGAVPFIRLMLRQDAEVDRPERIFTLDRILSGNFDTDLRNWARDARAFGTPLLVEWGTEANGQWFSWNGYWNGAGATRGFGDPLKADGPERFVAAYRHIVSVMRLAGATNVAWVFHVNADDDPVTSWNRMENYYPGDAYVGCIAVSAYGAQTPLDSEVTAFRLALDRAYPRLVRMAPAKPLIVAEFGCTAGNPLVRPEAWAQDALLDLLGGRWPKIVGFAWWNEAWQNDNHPAHDTTMRVQDIPALADVMRTLFSNNVTRLQTRPLFRP